LKTTLDLLLSISELGVCRKPICFRNHDEVDKIEEVVLIDEFLVSVIHAKLIEGRKRTFK